jgi:hypothetical protein
VWANYFAKIVQSIRCFSGNLEKLSKHSASRNIQANKSVNHTNGRKPKLSQADKACSLRLRLKRNCHSCVQLPRKKNQQSLIATHYRVLIERRKQSFRVGIKVALWSAQCGAVVKADDLSTAAHRDVKQFVEEGR